MDQLGSDISFSADMEGLDFPSGEPAVTRSSLPLQILPPEGGYSTAAGLDLPDYGMSLSPNIGMNHLGDSVLGLAKSGDASPGSLHGSFDHSMPLTVRSVVPDSNTPSPSVTLSKFTGRAEGSLDTTPIDVQSLLLANLHTPGLVRPLAGRPSVSTVSTTAHPAPNHPMISISTPYLQTIGVPKNSKSLWTTASCTGSPASSIITTPSSSNAGSHIAPTLMLSNPTALTPEPMNVSLLTGLPSVLDGTKATVTTGANMAVVSSPMCHPLFSAPILAMRTPPENTSTLTVSTEGATPHKVQPSVAVTSAAAVTPRPVKLEISKVSDNTTVLKLSFVHEQTSPDKSLTDSDRPQDFVLNPQLLSNLFSDKTLQDMTRLLSPEFASPQNLLSLDSSQEVNSENTLDCLVKPGDDVSISPESRDMTLNPTQTISRFDTGTQESKEVQSDENDNKNDDDTLLNRMKQKMNIEGNNLTGDVCGSRQGSSQEEKADDYTVGDHLGNLITSIDKSGDMPTAVQFSQILATQGRGVGVDKSELNVHIDDSQCIVRDGQRRWACNRCDKSYTTKHNLVTHTLAHSGIKPHCCVICGKLFKQVSHLNTHMLTHTTIRPHACKICNRTFTQTSHVKRHMAVHMERRPYVCEICGRGFAYPCELKSHVEKHNRSKDNICDTCGAAFDSPVRLKAHVQVSHRDEADLTCKECGKRYTYPSQLRDHMIKHSGKRPFMCGECGMEFMKEHHLKAHQFTHTGLKPWLCQICFRSFNQKANMQRHMLVHENDKKFECEVCNRSFSQPQTLKAHQVTHAEKKPYQCTVCGKQFGRLHNLQGHMHMHQDSRPHVCFCGAAFTLKGNLNRHKKVKHGLTDPGTECTDEEAAQILNSMSSKRSLDSVDGFPDTEHNYPKNKRKSVPRKTMSKVSRGERSGGAEQGDSGQGDRAEGSYDTETDPALADNHGDDGVGKVGSCLPQGLIHVAPIPQVTDTGVTYRITTTQDRL